MSSDEAFGKKYNIAPNPYKGAQASVLARFGKQAQTLAGVAGDGPAVAGEASAATQQITAQSTRALGLSKSVADSQSRLTRINEEMASDTIEARGTIQKAKIAQQEDVSVIEQMSGGLVAIQQLTGLARAMEKAGGGDTNTSVNTEQYEEVYEHAVLIEMNKAGVERPEDLEQSVLERIHKTALSGSRKQQNILGKVAGGIAGVVEDIPIIGDSLQALRRQNVVESRVKRIGQESIETADMVRKGMEEQAEFLDTITGLFGQPITVPIAMQKMFLEQAGDDAEVAASFKNLLLPMLLDAGFITQGAIDTYGTEAPRQYGNADYGTGSPDPSLLTGDIPAGEEFYGTIKEELTKQASIRDDIQNPEVMATLGALQASLETGHGEKKVGNNYFGIKASDGQDFNYAVTQEEVDGKMVTETAKFANYGSSAESSSGYLDFIMDNPRYKNVRSATTVEGAIEEIAKAGYATDSEYAKKLLDIYNSGGRRNP